MINNAKADKSAAEDDWRSNLNRADSKPCPTCNGSGRMITGYGVVCTEIVEKIAECSDCRGKGFIVQMADIKGD
jgi:DnaJ-class molecular chaperone